MTTRSIHRVDLVSGLVVTALGTAGLVESLRMPRFEVRGIDPFTVPGLTPGLLSAVLCVLGALLLIRGLLGRSPEGVRVTITEWTRASAIRTLFTIAALLVYGLFLFGHIHFIAATALFVFAFTLGTELINAERRLSLPVLLIGAGVLAFATAFAVHYVFTGLFLVRLPG